MRMRRDVKKDESVLTSDPAAYDPFLPTDDRRLTLGTVTSERAIVALY
jgi:hypothetical protein